MEIPLIRTPQRVLIIVVIMKLAGLRACGFIVKGTYFGIIQFLSLASSISVLLNNMHLKSLLIYVKVS